MKEFLLAALLAATTILAAPPASSSAAPDARSPVERASLPDIEDEVMCPTCGVPLALAFSPQAERERRFIRSEIAHGKTKDQIKDALVSEFGANVLALPDTDDSSFNWAAYLVPVAALLVAGVALLLALRRWRWRAADEAGPPDAELTAAQTTRLEQDISRYDI